MIEELKITKKVKCDHCGEIFNSGLINVCNHSYECKAAETIDVGNGFSFVYTPFISITPVPDEEPQQQ